LNEEDKVRFVKNLKFCTDPVCLFWIGLAVILAFWLKVVPYGS